MCDALASRSRINGPLLTPAAHIFTATSALIESVRVDYLDNTASDAQTHIYNVVRTVDGDGEGIGAQFNGGEDPLAVTVHHSYALITCVDVKDVACGRIDRYTRHRLPVARRQHRHWAQI